MKIQSTLFIEIDNFDFFFVVASFENDYEFKLLFRNSVPIEGIHNGQITDIKSILNIFKKNIYTIEQKLNLVFKEVVLVVSNSDNPIINISGYKKLSGSQLVKENITYILNSLKSKISEIEKEKTILHIFNSKYNLDNKELKNLPIGLFGDFYSHELSFFLINSHNYKNLIDILNKCNLKVKKIISKKFIDGANLINENLGVETFVKIEINKNNSQIIYFQNSSLKFFEDFKFGSDIILNDISKIIGLEIENAREILINTDFSNPKSREEFIKKKFFRVGHYKEIKKELIFEIAYARIKELSEIMLFKNINLDFFIKKKIPLFLKINDEIIAKSFLESFKLFFSKKNKYQLKFLGPQDYSSLYNDALKIVHYGWKKEAVPIIVQKKSIIERFFNLFFN